MEITNYLADEIVLVEIGGRLARRRLDLGLTQADLAEQAGIGKRTVERIEAGASAQMSSMIRIFRVLDLLSSLDHMLPATAPGPMDLLKRRGKVRQRAPGRGHVDRLEEPWTWGDET